MKYLLSLVLFIQSNFLLLLFYKILIINQLEKEYRMTEYKKYVTDFSPIVIRREKPLSNESAMTNLKRIYYTFGFIKKRFSLREENLELQLLLKENIVRSFFLQVRLLSVFHN